MRRRGETLAVRALDPKVSQEVLNLTIAYKAETNVVDIVPQAKRLRLSLNRPFAELDAPKGIAKNAATLTLDSRQAIQPLVSPP